MDDLLGSLPGGMWVRTKHAEKALRGQSTILEPILGNYP